MALAIRMARGGRKNRPHYKIVVADKRMPRDGRFIEKLGTYDPLLNGDRPYPVLAGARCGTIRARCAFPRQSRHYCYAKAANTSEQICPV